MFIIANSLSLLLFGHGDYVESTTGGFIAQHMLFLPAAQPLRA
ncbi:MAG: hypothetical protein ACRDTR_11735 [Rubrobacter sp.]